jgi:hypothetical protein
MRKNGNSGDSIYAFLEASGILKRGTKEEIAHAKKQYWNKKKREWKKRKLENHKLFEIYLDIHQLKLIQRNAGECDMSVTKYIKHMALQLRPAISDEVFGQIRQSLMQTQYAIEALLEENNIPSEISDKAIRHMQLSGMKILELLKAKKCKQ